jgi:FkbM family methyltransferase
VLGLANYVEKLRAALGMARSTSSASHSGEDEPAKHPGITRVEITGGVCVCIDTAEIDFGHVINRYKTWEPHLIQLIVDCLRSGDVYVDIGANVGVMAFNAAKAVGVTGKVIGFEPDPTNCNLFLRGLIANGFQNVSLIPVALSDQPAIFSLTGSSNSYLIEANDTNRLIQSLPGDFLLAGEPRIDFIKIDIEGYEPFALKGLAQTLRRHKPLVLCEFNPRCLKDHVSIDPLSFAHDLFGLTSTIEAVAHDGKRHHVKTAGELIALWEEKNAQAVSSGFLPDGLLHFDLLFTTER